MGICGQSSSDIINELYFEVAIAAEDVNKEIYFLDNTKFTDPKTKKEHKHDFLSEVNEHNTQLYINYKKTKFQKYFYINLIRVDFTKFKTNYLKKVEYMFYCCTNLIEINFTFFDTYNVTDMSFMFYFWSHLEKLDIGIFDTND